MENTEQERHSWIKFALIFLWLLIFSSLSILASSSAPEMNTNDANMRTLNYAGQIIGVIILFILPSVLFASLWTRSRIHYLGITTKPAFSTLLIASIGILMAFPFINWLAYLNGQMHLPDSLREVEVWMRNSEARAAEMTEMFTRGTSVSVLLLNLFVVAFMAAFSEELFFRGMLQKVLIECFKNKHLAIWTGAIFFSAFHMQFFGFIPRMLMGAYLGYIFLWSGSIWPGMIAHFVNNGMAVFLIWLSNRGVIPAETDDIGMESNQWSYVLVSTVMVIISMVAIYRMEKKKQVPTVSGN